MCLGHVGSNSVIIYEMTEEFRLALPKLAFAGIQGHSGGFNSLESCCQPLIVLLCVAPKYQNIVHEAQDTVKV